MIKTVLWSLVGVLAAMFLGFWAIGLLFEFLFWSMTR
jgi:hypothetical protein